MIVRIVTCIATAMALSTFLACAEEETEIPVDQVPAHVLKAVEEAVPGIKISEAEVETEDGKTVYEFEGQVGADSYEVEVDADGKLLEVEKGKGDADDDEDDDAGDDDEND